MINVASDFDSAKSFGSSDIPVLTPGGHICRILNARQEKARSGADMLVIAFDIEEHGEFDGYYAKRHERARGYNPDAKWQGIFRTSIMTKEGKTNSFFKGLIVAVEESNTGYNFKAAQFNEATLKGKLVGFNFGIEEYLDSKGEIRESVKPAWAVSVERVREGIEPPRRKPYQQPAGTAAAEEFTEVHEKLPWDD